MDIYLGCPDAVMSHKLLHNLQVCTLLYKGAWQRSGATGGDKSRFVMPASCAAAFERFDTMLSVNCSPSVAQRAIPSACTVHGIQSVSLSVVLTTA